MSNNHIIAQLYKITCDVNCWVYWGMVYAANKTYLDRFEEHKIGKGGKHLYKGILEYGESEFRVELVETGDFEYISKREELESKHTLYAHGSGWNGNSGHSIFNTPETIKIINSKRQLKEVERIAKFKESYGQLDQQKIQEKRSNTIANKSVSEIHKWRKSIPNSWRGDTKKTNKKLRKQSNALKKTWENPTDAMIEGIRKSANWKIGKNKDNWDVMRKHSEKMKIKVKGKNNPMFKHFYITPLGKFETYQEASNAHGAIKKSSIQRLCKNPDKIITKTIAKFSNLDFSFINKTAKEAGFGLEFI